MDPDLPALPEQQDGEHWSANTLLAYDILSDISHHAIAALHSDADHHRLRFHSETIMHDAMELIVALAEYSEIESFPEEWIDALTEHFGFLIGELGREADNADAR
jgi:hypothetical protein